MADCGSYRGVKFVRRRICDVLAIDCRARWYFTLDVNGEPDGNHFRTLAEMYDSINSGDYGTRPIDVIE